MENFFMSEAQAAREAEEEAARRRREIFKPFSGEGGSSFFSTSSTSSSAFSSSAPSLLSGMGEPPQETVAGTAAAVASEGSAADTRRGDSATTVDDEVDPLDMYMSSITEQVRQQDEETRQRLQREAEEKAAATAAAAAGEQAAGGSGAALEGTGGSGQHTGLQRGLQVQLSSLSASSFPPGSGSCSSSSSCSSSQRIFADDDDPLADSFEHVLIERERAAEVQAARVAQGAWKRKGDATDFVSDDEEADEKTKSKVLPSTDHSKWLYPSFVKDIYTEFKQIEELTHAEVGELKRSLQLRTFGKNVPRPIASFLHLKDTFSSALFTGLHKRGFSLPTPIQSAAIPCLLRGRDLLAVAETGSGKTAAYLIPLLARLQHLQEQQQWTRQRVVPSDDTQPAAMPSDVKGSSSKAAVGRGLLPHGGPAALVVCPTRELAVQLDGEVHALVSKSKKGASALMLRRVLLAGGFDKTEQFKQLKQGVDLAICTPGRVIDTAATKGMQNFFQKVVAVVVDEADKLVDMGFEVSLRSILHSVRPDRLTAMFSATFSPACESLARQFLDNPIKIIVGEQGQAAKAVEQNVVIVADEKKKFRWLADNILSLLARPPPPAIAAAAAAQAAASCEEEQQQGRVAVIFCNTQQRCEDLAHLLEEELSQLLHRQQEQQEQGGAATQESGQAIGGETATERDAASAAAAAPNTRTAAARLLQLETDDNPSVLKRNPHQTFKYSTVVHGGLNLTERLAAIRRLHQHILHPPAEAFSLPGGVAAPLLLIATDVASRGLDFPGALALVVSYDAPQEAEVYVHRIGRAGRAGRRGRAYALLTRAEKRAAAFIVESMRTVEQEPPRQLLDLAMLYAPFKAATLAGVKMQEPKKQSGKKARRYLDNGLAGLGYSRDEAGERSSSPSRKKGKSVASLVARAAAAAAEALKQQQQATAAAAGSDDGVIGLEGFAGEGEGAGGRGGGTTAAAGDASSVNAGAAETKLRKQQQPGGLKRGRWDSDEKKGSAPAGNTLDCMRAVGSGSSSLLHSTDSTGLNATGGSSTTATGKVVGIHDELSSDEDEAAPGMLLQQHRNPLQQQQQLQQQQYYLPQQQQQQQYAPTQLGFQQPVESQQHLFDQPEQQRQTHEQPYHQQQCQQQPYSQQQQDLQHPHNAEVESIVQQAAAAAAAARAAAVQVVASKASAYAACGSSSCHSVHASSMPASTLSAAGDLSYDDTDAAAAAGGASSGPACIPAGAGRTASCPARETATAAGFSGVGNAGSLCATGTTLAAAAGSPLSAAGSIAGAAALPKRSSVLNLEKREQRRKQWLVNAEARREQLRLQRTVAAQKEQQQRDPSPVRKSFSERPHSTAAAGRTIAGGAAAPAGGGRGATMSSDHSAGSAGCAG